MSLGADEIHEVLVPGHDGVVSPRNRDSQDDARPDELPNRIEPPMAVGLELQVSF